APLSVNRAIGTWPTRSRRKGPPPRRASPGPGSCCRAVRSRCTLLPSFAASGRLVRGVRLVLAGALGHEHVGLEHAGRRIELSLDDNVAPGFEHLGDGAAVTHRDALRLADQNEFR